MVSRTALACAAVVTCLVPHVARAACSDLLPRRAAVPLVGRDITPDDLARLRDIGHPDADADDGTPFAVSPDGARLAFVINRADPATNTICRGLAVMPTDGRAAPILLDRGGELPMVAGDYRGVFATVGYPATVVPSWSPDGHWLAYLKREHGVTQVWRVAADGSGATQMTQAPSDVERVAWAEDGRSLLFVTRPAVAQVEALLDAQSLSGWHYDARVWPEISLRPQPAVSEIPLATFVVDPDTGAVRPASVSETASLLSTAPPGYPGDHGVRAANGTRAWTKVITANPLGPEHLFTADASGRVQECTAAACTGSIGSLWWDDDGRSLVFERREGWDDEATALYRWRLGAAAPLLIVRTLDTLSGCQRQGERLLCLRENAVTPHRIVAVSLTTGRSTVVFDPNPRFAGLRRGHVSRLHWSTDRGLPVWGDLVVPPGYDGKARLPLVIVGYTSRGFLRGGVGDEYPIFALAARGFAVLSYQRPPHIASLSPAARSWADVNGVGHKDFAERRSLLSAVERGADAAIARGVADPKRIGITGLSDGASTVEFALVNSTRFAAAIVSTCCTSPVTDLAIGGTAYADWNHDVLGEPNIGEDPAYWRPLSFAANGDRVKTPVLMQLADREARLALEGYAALREARDPVDMFVFADEYHNKWQPAHRLAIYRRVIDWFGFWLQGQEDPDPAKRAQYARWEALRHDPGAQSTP
jgi:dipeptidyl aminopeptidase/acylaminoacyl peptidase